MGPFERSEGSYEPSEERFQSSDSRPVQALQLRRKSHWTALLSRGRGLGDSHPYYCCGRKCCASHNCVPLAAIERAGLRGRASATKAAEELAEGKFYGADGSSGPGSVFLHLLYFSLTQHVVSKHLSRRLFFWRPTKRRATSAGSGDSQLPAFSSRGKHSLRCAEIDMK